MAMGNQWQPTTDLAKLVSDLGFEYRVDQDLLVSRHDAWQRNVGFTWAYDVLPPRLLMDLDCEPIYFTYGGKDWMIELWKGPSPPPSSNGGPVVLPLLMAAVDAAAGPAAPSS
jgi:uncharacterized protein DUF4474